MPRHDKWSLFENRPTPAGQDDELLAPLREAIRAQKVVPVMGSGVSQQTAGLPGWKGAIESALAHARTTGSARPSDCAQVQQLLDRGGDLVAAAEAVRKLLRAPHGEYSTWLKKAFGIDAPAAKSGELINAIADLLCPLIATTNYDRLLSHVMPSHPEPITWRQSMEMQAALRGEPRVLHLHGLYSDPESVIFGNSNYDELAKDEAYKAMMSALWLERTLLFIGCSLDGIRDPDLGKLLVWACRTFRGSSYKHYALVHEGDADANHKQEFLHEWRIQLITYGPTHSDLAAKVRALNPHANLARASRLKLIEDIARGGGFQHDQDLKRLLDESAKRDSVQVEDLSVVAEALLATQRVGADKQRRDLAAAQRLARSIINTADLQRESGRWRMAARSGYDGSFRDAVSQARLALKLFRPDLLAALSRSGVYLHAAVLSGESEHLVNSLELASAAGECGTDYEFENARRILDTAQKLLGCDPERVLPVAGAGDVLPRDFVKPCLLIARKDCLELRLLQPPYAVAGRLPHHAEMMIALAPTVQWQQATAICAWENEQVFLWDPRRAASPIARFAVSEVYGAYGIGGVALARDGELLHAAITTMDGPVHALVDFQAAQTWRPHDTRNVESPVLLDDGSLYVLTHGRFNLLRLAPGRDGEYEQIWTSDDLWQVLRRVKPVAAAVEALKAREEILLRHRIAWEELHLQDWTLQAVAIGGRTVLGLYAQVYCEMGRISFVLLLEPKHGVTDVIGHFHCGDPFAVSCRFHTAADGRPRLTYALEAPASTLCERVGWAYPVPTQGGLQFVEEHRLLRSAEYLVDVVCGGDGQGFAADEKGVLHAFSLKDRRCHPVAQQNATRIAALGLVNWC